MKKNDALQILRAIAALLVAYAHSIDAVAGHSVPKQVRFYFLENFGACGVDIFFAISGFILSSVIVRIKPETPHKTLDFIVRRYIRIVPIYWLVSLFPLTFALKHSNMTIGWLLSSFLLLPSLSFPLQSPILSAGWTLLFEMFFYYVLALNLLFGRRKIIARVIISILIFVGIGAIAGFQRPLLILIANPMNIEFAMGCCAALISTRLGHRRKLGTGLVLLGGAALGMTIIFGYRNADDSGFVLNGMLSWYRVFRWGVPAAAFTAGFVLRPSEVRTTFGKLWVYLGDASYSTYLTSLYTLWFFSREYRYVAFIPADANIFLAFLMTVLVGAATYSFIERPLTSYISAKYQQTKKQPVSRLAV